MAATHAPEKSFADYNAMLADPDLEAVIIATSDSFHVPAAIRALEAGKHVLCEKPVATSVEAVEDLRQAVKASGKVLQVGHMKRFDPGLEAAADFIRDGMGEMVALKAWYCDSTHRYPMTDAVQPLMVSSANARKPAGNPKADLDRYYMLNGSILGKTFNPWYFKSSEVDIFHEAEGASRRVLGADGHFYRRQLEGFADVILNGAPMKGADIEDGVASVRAMVAIAQSVRDGGPVRLDQVSGEV